MHRMPHQAKVSNEGQRQAQQQLHERLVQEWMPALTPVIAHQPVIAAQVAQPQAPHVQPHLLLQPLPSLHTFGSWACKVLPGTAAPACGRMLAALQSAAGRARQDDLA